MKLINFFLFLFLSFCIFSNISYSFTISPESIDLGKVRKFHQTKRYILFTNETHKDIQILGIVNACGLALNLDKKILKPGEIIEGILYFDAGTPQGGFEESIKLVYTEGEIIKEKKILVSWYTYPEKYPEIIITKKEFDLGEILPKTPVPFELEIENTGNMVLTVNAKIEEGFLLNLPVDIQPGERRIVKGSLVVDKPEKSIKKLVLESNDLSNPKIEITFSYDAKWDIKKGISFNIDQITKTDSGYAIPIKIYTFNHAISYIEFEDLRGNKIKVEGDRTLFKNDEGNLILNITEKEYEEIRKGNIYIKIGFSIDD